MSWTIPPSTVPHLKKLEGDVAELSRVLKVELSRTANEIAESLEVSMVASLLKSAENQLGAVWLNYFKPDKRPKLIAHHVANKLLEDTETHATAIRRFHEISQTKEIDAIFHKYPHLDQAWQCDKRRYFQKLMLDPETSVAVKILELKNQSCFL
jgi:hypothetical protein